LELRSAAAWRAALPRIARLYVDGGASGELAVPPDLVAASGEAIEIRPLSEMGEAGVVPGGLAGIRRPEVASDHHLSQWVPAVTLRRLAASPLSAGLLAFLARQRTAGTPPPHA
jgi:hypothetical protein